MMFQLAADILTRLDIRIELVNLGGGIGIAYKPSEKPVDLKALSSEIAEQYRSIIRPTRLHPLRVAHECGRVVTGPHGYLITRVIHQKNTYKNYIGLDACMAHLMRPGMYKAYHHITIVNDDGPHPNLPSNRNLFSANQQPTDGGERLANVFDVVGGLCENNDKFAIDRELPSGANIGDLAVIHDVGAHGHAMGFNYNGKLRSAEYLWSPDGTVSTIRNAETYCDLFHTLPNSCAVTKLTCCSKKGYLAVPAVSLVLGVLALKLNSSKNSSSALLLGFGACAGATALALSHYVAKMLYHRRKAVYAKLTRSTYLQ
jgi:diaminopimelate decarboxylase